MNLRIGQGFDVHRFAAPEESRPLMLMGLTVPHDRGLAGHSDADVMLHALMDALLGAAGLGDIGQHFPDTDAAYASIDSRELLRDVMQKIRALGYHVVNADLTVLAQAPKLARHIPAVCALLAQELGNPAFAGLEGLLEDLGVTPTPGGVKLELARDSRLREALDGQSASSAQ